MTSWLRTDEAEEAVAGLEAAARFLSETSRDPYAWRWAIVSLHIATQGFMVVVLRDSAGLLPLRDNVAKAWLKADRNGGELPVERLDSFGNLYRKVKRAKVAGYLAGKPFKPTGSQDRSIRLLCSLRNQFIHFLPASWSLDLNGLPTMARDVLAFIEFLSRDYRTIIWHNEQHPGRSTAALSSARRALDSIDRRE